MSPAMNLDTLTDITQTVAGIIFSAIGIWFTWRTAHQDRAKKRLELEESSARMDLALNLTMQTKLHRCGEHLFLETFVDIHNPSHKTWAIPMVYISYRALIDTAQPSEFTGREGFDDLPLCEGLRLTRNRAYLPDSIWSADPDERVRLVRIDRLPAELFQKRYPVLWVNVEAFGASYELLGKQRTILNGYGEYRRKWLEFSTSLERQDAAYMAIGRLNPEVETDWEGFSPGDRCILASSAEGSRPDKNRSAEFKALLDSMTQWTIDSTINVSAMLSEPTPNQAPQADGSAAA